MSITKNVLAGVSQGVGAGTGWVCRAIIGPSDSESLEGVVAGLAEDWAKSQILVSSSRRDDLEGVTDISSAQDKLAYVGGLQGPAFFASGVLSLAVGLTLTAGGTRWQMSPGVHAVVIGLLVSLATFRCFGGKTGFVVLGFNFVGLVCFFEVVRRGLPGSAAPQLGMTVAIAGANLYFFGVNFLLGFGSMVLRARVIAPKHAQVVINRVVGVGWIFYFVGLYVAGAPLQAFLLAAGSVVFFWVMLFHAVRPLRRDPR